MEDESLDGPSVFGVNLIPEASLESHTQPDTIIGSVLVDLTVIKRVNDLRLVLESQLDILPTAYRFLTKQRWPLHSNQEQSVSTKCLIDSSGVITIKHHYGNKQRIGVIAEDGRALGFVFFADMNLKVSHFRKAINFQLTEVRELWDNSWLFLDNNFWPVSTRQEEDITVLQVLSNHSVRVRFGGWGNTPRQTDSGIELKKDVPTPPPNKIQKMERQNSVSSNEEVVCYTQPHSMSPLHSITEADSPVKGSSQPAKQVLISYVRAEASQYALDLKSELERLRLSVYLDVHEIFGGSDWQDSLNYAVSNCEVFVPLVTPRYGETQWTNREIKLADVLHKYIVPVSFLKFWPPRCLAIQFATTQFINWKLASSTSYASHGSNELNGIDSVDGCFMWDRPDVVAVSKEIVKRCKREAMKNKKNSSLSSSQVSRISRGFSTHFTVLPADDTDGGGLTRPSLVIISTHPAQETFAQELKEMFEEEKLRVWTTLDLNQKNGQDDGNSSDDTEILGSEQEIIGTSSQYNRELIFQAKVEEAGVIVFVLSKAFAESGTCKQQVFYCEQRKQVVPLKFEAFEMPGWMSLLIGTNTFEDVQRTDYKSTLLNRVRRAVDSDTVEDTTDYAKEVQIACAVQFICEKLPAAGCVYIAGGTKFFYPKSAAICNCIGQSLADLDVSVVTGGFYGVGDTISHSFYESRQKQGKDGSVWHILPVRDEQDRSAQARQNADKTFQQVPFGQTIYCGESVRQRETIVSRVFDICILVEGGPGAAHEAEEFTWSDHTVIPIRCTGGAAGGKFKVPEKIFEVPPGVDVADWQCLKSKDSSPEEIGQAVKSIVLALMEGAAHQMTCQKSFYKKPSMSRSRSLSCS